MIKLNHTNLAVSNVPEFVRFFQTAFGFSVIHQRGLGKFVVMLGEDGFVLTLTHDKNVATAPYPAPFHIGFLFDSQDQVHQHYDRITAVGFDAPTPAMLQRSGPKAYGFYCQAPGGVTVEVSTPAD